MLNQKDIIKSISRIDLFKSLSDDDLQVLIQNSSRITLAPGEELFPYGSETSAVYYIISGGIIIHFNRKIISRLGPGEYFGEMALVDNGPRSAAAKAGPETELIEFSAEICRKVFSKEAGVWESIAKTLSKRLRETNTKDVELYEYFNMNVHDMRNFLSALGYAELMLLKLPEEDEVNRKYLSYIITANENLKDIMESTMMAIQDHSLTRNISFDDKVDIVSLINNCVESLEAHKDIKRMKSVNVILENDIEPVCCNPLNIKRVISNLIINAAQASGDGGHIKIRVSQIEDKAIIVVSDEGSGMTEEVMAHVFEQFYTTKKYGNGLGLASCRDIIETHGGTLTCSSTVGAGSDFKCEFPVKQQKVGI